MTQKQIFIRYAANPNWPNKISHTDKKRLNLVKVRTRVFPLDQYEEALAFLMECTIPLTKVSSILWAFPRKRAFDILQAMDLLKEEQKYLEEEFKYEELKDSKTSEDDIFNVLRSIEIKDLSYSELLNYEDSNGETF